MRQFGLGERVVGRILAVAPAIQDQQHDGLGAGCDHDGSPGDR